MIINKDEPDTAASRRSVLTIFAGGGVSAILASLSSRPARADQEDTTLGDFESGLNGWTTNGGNRLSIVERSERPAAVTQGEKGLKVTIEGDPYPLISNKRRVKSVDFVQNPYLVADVAPGPIDGTTSPVSFTFRLHHSAGTTNDGSENRERDGGSQRSALVEESDPMTVRQAAVGRLFWDMSDIDDRKLNAAKRLDIAWHPIDYEPEDGPNGRGTGSDYRGNVVFDNVRATDAVESLASARIASTLEELEFAHGPYVKTEVTAELDTLEEGEFVFSDGTTKPYRFEVLTGDKFLFTIGDTDVKLGGGWE